MGWNGTEPNGPSRLPSATADGRFVVFESDANNLVKGDSNGWSDIFLRDTCIGAASTCVPATTRLSIATDGSEANGASFSPAISPDGRFVEFNSVATNLTRLDFGLSIAPAAATPLFFRDTCFGATSACMPATSRVIPASASQR
jgi:Tol biopolymer transport system component